jgi:endogenous inhibitor of DNA gyrase (YacG/DUF329 family)
MEAILPMKKEITVECPTCEKKFSYYSSDYRPFCCEKCKMVDLGHWFDESYSVNGIDGSVYIEDKENFNPELDNEY